MNTTREVSHDLQEVQLTLRLNISENNQDPLKRTDITREASHNLREVQLTLRLVKGKNNQYHQAVQLTLRLTDNVCMYENDDEHCT